jgi:hypothetical protein
MQDLLTELNLLRSIELSDSLNELQQKRYMEIIEICQRNNIEIPFGVEY